MQIYRSSPKGLTDDQVQERIEKVSFLLFYTKKNEVFSYVFQFGENKIEHKERHPIIQFLLFMWNPLSW